MVLQNLYNKRIGLLEAKVVVTKTAHLLETSNAGEHSSGSMLIQTWVVKESSSQIYRMSFISVVIATDDDDSVLLGGQ